MIKGWFTGPSKAELKRDNRQLRHAAERLSARLREEQLAVARTIDALRLLQKYWDISDRGLIKPVGDHNCAVLAIVECILSLESYDRHKPLAP